VMGSFPDPGGSACLSLLIPAFPSPTSVPETGRWKSRPPSFRLSPRSRSFFVASTAPG
jgi:hypothetical protein